MMKSKNIRTELTGIKDFLNSLENPYEIFNVKLSKKELRNLKKIRRSKRDGNK